MNSTELSSASLTRQILNASDASNATRDGFTGDATDMGGLLVALLGAASSLGVQHQQRL